MRGSYAVFGRRHGCRVERLADGTNIVMNGLADGTEQILSDLSEADDGQAKDSILKAFGELVGDAGTAA